MKRVLYGAILSALLTTGCVYKSPFVWPEPDPAPADVQPQKRPAAVRADQITIENAHQKAREVEDDIEFDRSGSN